MPAASRQVQVAATMAAVLAMATEYQAATAALGIRAAVLQVITPVAVVVDMVAAAEAPPV